ncbi:serine hydrolase [Caballeronia novacaledonica]|uniref:Serine hydrolase n=1 Tax=Caballeronia novacaledonica TaxID=1544861 RepID=A0AA37IGQ9_9BURK|nr:serine hydrolase domain-containing protein [Caballeronia novacaledonica]GJH29372.1 serine hydrolase [Caballeronia novacaledonica]
MKIEVVEPSSVGVDDGALTRLREGFTNDVARGRHFGGTLLLARRGGVVLHEGIGYLDAEKKRSATTDALYCNMSLSKAYVAGMVLQLIDQGKLSLSTRIADIIPEYGVRGKGATEIWHLMNHTAGTWSGFVPPPPLAMSDTFNMERMVAAIASLSVAFHPGSQVCYSPAAGHILLGEIVQRITGRGFAEVTRERLFEPLGMTRARYGLDPEDPNHVRICMVDHNPGSASIDVMEGLNELMRSGRCLPGGSAFATAYDVFRFAEMQRQGGSIDGVRFLSPALVEYATRNSTGSLSNTFWDFSRIDRGISDFPANFTLFGGYARGSGHYLTPLGYTASPSSYGAVGSGSTMYLVDPKREMVFVFLSAGLTEGLGHFQDICRLADLAIAACDA